MIMGMTAKKRKPVSGRRRKRRLRPWVKVLLAVLFLAVLFVPVRFLVSCLFHDGSPYRKILNIPSDPSLPPISYDETAEIFRQNDSVLKDCLLTLSEDGLHFYIIRLDPDGKILHGWYEKDGRRFYYDDETGRQYSGLCEVDGQERMFLKNGALADRDWVRSGKAYYWYENGSPAAEKSDQILFVKDEEGFYYLAADQSGARLADGSVTLADGRVARFDGEGHLLREENAESLVFPLPEAYVTATETVRTDASAYKKELQSEPIRYISHRGYHPAAPENSLAAYQESYAQGYQYVECDIQITRDQVPVLLHNPSINEVARNADGSLLPSVMYVYDLTYDELLNYDFGLASSAAYAGMKVTRLDTFLAYCSSVGLHPYLELKMETVNSQEDVDMIVDIVRQQNMENRVSWISFSPDDLAYVLNDLPEAEVGYLLSTEETAAMYMPRILERKAQGYNVFVDAAHPLVSMVSSSCQAAGIPLQIWMVNWPDYLASMDPYISGITTDNLLPPYER